MQCLRKEALAFEEDPCKEFVGSQKILGFFMWSQGSLEGCYCSFMSPLTVSLVLRWGFISISTGSSSPLDGLWGSWEVLCDSGVLSGDLK